MIATGIVRRIDDLGRIVIPKELRRKIEIEAGDPLEIFYNPETRTIMLNKYVEPEISGVHMWDCQQQKLEAKRENIKYAYYLRCETDEARKAVAVWLLEEEDADSPDWEQNPNGIWQDVGEDEESVWEDLDTLKARAMEGYALICKTMEELK